jgi:hypothetical protein
MSWTAEEISKMAGQLAKHFRGEAKRWAPGGEFATVATAHELEHVGRLYVRLLAATGALRDIGRRKRRSR